MVEKLLEMIEVALERKGQRNCWKSCKSYWGEKGREIARDNASRALEIISMHVNIGRNK